MRKIQASLIGLALILLSSCGASKFRSYDGPEVTRVIVYKAERKMYLLSGTDVLRGFDVGLGFAPRGDKKVEGDGKTPSGTYLIDRRNPKSRYHLSIGISYPNHYDRAEAASLGRKPGGDIFIHGRGKFYKPGSKNDWTWGCIAVTDAEMEEIYAMVRNGTPISIFERRPTLRKAVAKNAVPPGPPPSSDVTAPVVPAAAPVIGARPEAETR